MDDVTHTGMDPQRAAMDEIGRLIKSVRQGRLTDRANAGVATGDFKEVLSNINELMDVILLPIGEGNRILDQVAHGKVNELITETYQGDHEKMKQNVNGIAARAAAVPGRTGQTDSITATRASWRSVAMPRGSRAAMPTSSRASTRCSMPSCCRSARATASSTRSPHGKVDELITQTYQGDHEKMKQNVNGIALVLQRFQAELAKLIELQPQGQLEKRGDADGIPRRYAEIIKGINQMLDAILLPIGEGNRILDQIAHGKVDELIAQTYQGDHEKMKQNVNSIALICSGSRPSWPS